MIIVAFIFVLCSEKYEEKNNRSSMITLWPLVIGNSILTFGMTIGLLATRYKIKLVLGSDQILHSYNHNSPANNNQGGIESELDQYRELAYNRYLNQLRWLGLIEVINVSIGILWSLWILEANTGEYPDSKLAKYLKDKNSLATTIIVTYIIPFILTVIHLGISIANTV